jgi:hypothetical protein
MSNSKNSQQIARPDVRVSIRLKNSEKILREVVLPTEYPLFADIADKAAQTEARKESPISEVLVKATVDAIIDAVYIEKAKAAKLKSVTVQAALDEFTHALCGMRLYKMRAAGNRQRYGSPDNAKIELLAWVPRS